MILQALTDYYETLLEDKKVAGQGWCVEIGRAHV